MTHNWIKSSFCTNSGCVEIARSGTGLVLVRDSASPGNALAFTVDEWDAFIAGAKAGEFDRPEA